MSEETKKNKRYTYNQQIIKALVDKHGFTPFFIRQCLSGHRNSITADKIRVDYKMLEKELKETIKQFNTK